MIMKRADDVRLGEEKMNPFIFICIAQSPFLKVRDAIRHFLFKMVRSQFLSNFFQREDFNDLNFGAFFGGILRNARSPLTTFFVAFFTDPSMLLMAINIE